MEPTDIAKSLDIEVIRNLLGPVTQEVGELLGDIGSIVRFYTASNLTKVFTAWARQRDGKPLQREDFVRVVPLLHAASLQSDEELHERWAALLQTSVTCPESTLPSFGQTLAQMTADEAKYLERLFMRAAADDLIGDRELGDLDGLLDIYDPELRISYNTQSRVPDCDAERLQSEVRYGKLLLEDLERLGLIIRNAKAEKSVFPSAFGPDIELRTVYALSEYGLHFIQAVTPKSLPDGQP